jgi:hypothetical protein
VKGLGSPEPPEGAADADHVVALHEHPLHVLDGGAYVLGGDVAAAQALHEAAVGAEEHLVLLGLGGADDDRLAAPQVEARRGRLVGHAAGEAEDVAQGVGLGVVVPHAAAAEGGAEGGVVDGDDGP